MSMACAISLVSCGDDDEDPVATAITVSSDVTSAEYGSTFTFTAEDDLGNDVTSEATFYVDGTSISGTSYTPDAIGTYEVYAVYEDLTSTSITIETVVPAEPDNGFVVSDGSTYTTDASLFIFYADYSDYGYNIWVTSVYNSETEEEIDIYLAISSDETYPGDGSYVYDSSLSSLPMAYIAGLYYGDTEIIAYSAGDMDLESLDLTIADLSIDEDGLTGTWSLDYDIETEEGTTVSGNYTGAWEFLDYTSYTSSKVSQEKDFKFKRVSLPAISTKF
ncbi:hypothetical protein SAMN05216480_10711 [Pustulibacterium marinum]|uniref:Uncharacterized protein n=1 Tax=Pustulibacterium marinum TaxID=1224947 RepID=A0A1I7H3F4_9FLAO|nr:hypothetical protein SAMN05216480_10711 [Pustulibacterium marinum]